MRFAVLYVMTIVLINWAFSVVPLLSLPGGELWSPVALIVGFIFVIRDYAQREIGHYVLIAMAVGAAISFVMAGPGIALASLTAFLVGECIDWAIFTFTGKPFSQRVLLSSAVSTPFDSAVFLWMVGIFSFSSVAIMTASKMVGAVLVFYAARQRERSLAERREQSVA